ncbi:MAG: pyrroloquinoline quinone biosynthesis protein PqqB [Devosia nanyangense]|uniref:Coenzyme PQQ synthesis protein B n=1 Tax=Devosia nanyangense TaxID=1228055 RepID=A0A933L5P4_9HYPH|nr:pyrroloquinoline quinone biosynthesis protein PqqB [Devosia nanyangense]
MLSIVILGAAAGGGVPQWNCGCANCRSARNGHPELKSTQASIAVSADQQNWFLINASPDLRQQLTGTPALHPRAGALRHSPVAGVILTNGEVDALAGLLSLREGAAFGLYAHRRVLDILDDNPIFNVLRADLVPRRAIDVGAAFEPTLPGGQVSGLVVEPFAVPGKIALYLEAADSNAEGDTIGLVIRDTARTRKLVFLAACAEVTPAIAARLEGADLVFFDGTLWRDDEMITAGLGQKTGQRMGHISMREAIPALAGLDIGRRVFLHINNSNPALRPDSPERREAAHAGWIVPADGMEITL